MESVLRAVTGEPRAQQVLAWQSARTGRKLPPALQQVELALARAIYPSLASNPAAASAAGGQTPSRLAHAVKPLAFHVDKAYVPPPLAFDLLYMMCSRVKWMCFISRLQYFTMFGGFCLCREPDFVLFDGFQYNMNIYRFRLDTNFNNAHLTISTL